MKIRGRRVKSIADNLRADFPAVATEAHFGLIAESAPVLGVETPEGRTRAYPVALMGAHIVNDAIQGEPALVTYCPRCRSGLAFDPRLYGRRLMCWLFGREHFRHSKHLYRVVFTEESGTLWNLEGEAIYGPHEGARLRPLATELTSWQEWRRRNPSTSLMIEDTDAKRSFALKGKPQPSRPANQETLEEIVLGLQDGEFEAACSLSELAKLGSILVPAGSAGESVLLLYDAASHEARGLWLKDIREVDINQTSPLVVRDRFVERAWEITGRSLAGGASLPPVATQRVTRLYGWLMDHPNSRLIGLEPPVLPARNRQD
jgi:hypothetical protein